MTSLVEKKPLRLIITGGGTGGHLFPGIAVAEAIMAERSGSEVLFIGTDRQLDNQVLGQRPFMTASLQCQGLKGKSVAAILGALVQLPRALFKAGKILRRFKPDLVLGVGGYVTGPVVLAAKLLGIPTCIHEQNSIPGLANKLLGYIANKIFVSLPGSEKYFPASKTILSGNPVRNTILKVSREAKPESGQESSTLLILGGSQGARRLNSLMLEAAENILSKLSPPPFIIHQTVGHDKNHVQRKYLELGLNARVQYFFKECHICLAIWR